MTADPGWRQFLRGIVKPRLLMVCNLCGYSWEIPRLAPRNRQLAEEVHRCAKCGTLNVKRIRIRYVPANPQSLD